MTRWRATAWAWVVVLTAAMLAGCARGPVYVAPEARTGIDRKNVEFPAGFNLKQAITGLTAPTAMAWIEDEGEYQGSVLIAESGIGGYRPRIYGFKPDGTFFEIYPRQQPIPSERIPFGLFRSGREIYGPIGGMVASRGNIYVTHRDAGGRGVVSAFDLEGNRTTIAADLPAQGDYGLTDITIHPTTGRLYFGAGAATNSGVVGLDNWQRGWVKRYATFCDLSAVPLKLLGYRFDTKNPLAGIFGGDDIAVTAPYQPFGISNQTRIAEAPNGKPTSTIYSVSPGGGDLRVEAHGIRVPAGMAFNDYANLFFTNQGMELRGTRPVKDDPDALLKFLPNTWYGFPDFSADLQLISESRYQPPREMIGQTGYPELSSLIDHAGSGLPSPTPFRDALVFGVFPALSGAGKFDFAPSSGPFREFRGNAIIALGGDRAPFANSGEKLKGPVGYKVVRLDLDTRAARDFIRNTKAGPGSRIEADDRMLERPIDVKFGPQGKLYVLDFGRLEMRNGVERVTAGSGSLWVLEPIETEQTAPSE